jgi:hypothetical protein
MSARRATTTGGGRAGRAGRLAAALAAALLVLAGCGRTYDQSSPEAVLTTAREMLENGDARRLHELIHAESPEMRRVLRELGSVLGNLEQLGREIQAAFPDEVQALRERAEQEATSGRASNFLADALTGQMRQRGRGRQDPRQMREAMTDSFQRFFADPYGWLREGEGRLGTEMIDDDFQAVTWDGRTVLPPMGVLLRRDGDKWYFALPTHLPAFSRALPQTKEEWATLTDVVKILDNTVVDLTEDVRRGRARHLNELAQNAGEKAFIPIAIGFYAYSRAAENRREEERRRRREAAGTG